MKTTILLFLTLTAAIMAAAVEDKTFLNKEGMATTNGEMIEAVSYGLAKEMKTDDFYVQNSKDFKNPLLVERLPPKVPLGGGPIETIDKLPSPEDYYDGTRGLKMTYSQCNQFIQKEDACSGKGNCGWCGEKQRCVQGTAAGPIESCLRGTYSFGSNKPDFSTLPTNDYTLQRANVGGAQLTTIVTK